MCIATASAIDGSSVIDSGICHCGGCWVQASLDTNYHEKSPKSSTADTPLSGKWT